MGIWPQSSYKYSKDTDTLPFCQDQLTVQRGAWVRALCE